MARITWRIVGQERVRIFEVGPVDGGPMAAERCIEDLMMNPPPDFDGDCEVDIIEPSELAGRYRVEYVHSAYAWAKRMS